MSFALGEKVQHKLSEFTGIVESRCEHLNRETQYGVQSPTLGTDGTPSEKQWFAGNELILNEDTAPDKPENKETDK